MEIAKLLWENVRTMSRKLTYQDVVNACEQNGYQLAFKEIDFPEVYRGTDSKVPVFCPICGELAAKTLGNIKKGQMGCAGCKGERIRQAKAFTQEEAEAEGRKFGAVLIGQYVNARIPVTWLSIECGHAFERALDRLEPNAVCTECAWRRVSAHKIAEHGHSIDDLNRAAREIDSERNPQNNGHGAVCMATQQVGVKTKVPWKCSRPDHPAFTATPDSVLNNRTWCPKCAPTKPPTPIEELQEKVRRRGGTIVEIIGTWRGGQSKIRYQCERGHKWGPIPAAHLLQADKWCPICQPRWGEKITRAIFETTFGAEFPERTVRWMPSDTGRGFLKLDGYNEELKLAFEYQGPHHFTDIEVATRDAQKVQLCSEHGVTLIIVNWVNKPFPPENVLAQVERAFHESHITENAILPIVDIFEYEMKELQRLADKRGGRLLSKHFAGNEAIYSWKCANPDHRPWTASAYNIRKGHWCPHCAGVAPLGLDVLRAWGDAVGLDLLDTEYKRAATRYNWKCRSYGHTFARVKSEMEASIANGLPACPDCAGTSKNAAKMLEEVLACITARGWTLNGSMEGWAGARSLLTLKCRNGHVFTRTWNKIQSGAGCGHRGCTDSVKWPKWVRGAITESRPQRKPRGVRISRELLPDADLTDEQWQRIAAILPLERVGGRGAPSRPHRQIIDGIFWVMREGTAWSTLPPEFGSWQVYRSRYFEWSKDGTIDRVLAALIV
jgi:hypothetical protein